MALTWFQGNRGLVVGLGCGVLLGMSGTLIVQQLSSGIDMRLAQLVTQIDSLRYEIDQLKGQLPATAGGGRAQRKVRMGYYSVHASSGEDNDDSDDFQDALNSLDVAASKLNSLTGDEFLGVASVRGAGYVEGADPQPFFDQMDELLQGTDEEKQTAFNLLKAARDKLDSNPNFLWRLCKATYFMSQIEGVNGNDARKKALIYEALDLAQKGLEIDDNIPYLHKWVAITLGSVGDYESNKVRMANGFKFKEHIQRAIQLKPDDPSNHYLLGRWSYGVYMMTWVERKLAATLFGEPPSATVDEALKEFLKAERLEPNHWKENMLYIAKCYIEKKDYYETHDWLVKADELPTVSADEKEAQKEIDQLLYTYSGYKRS